ncbi:UDP-N-acetylmuramoyl-L-alanyl-D-glutamate--2,6-di aminopimelate ligase [Deferribacterales bacterium RsTz2092]|nr:UDP-N-acetylmuramoyl-L-alanyl-D-glutamate--2,6-diaminopimelate ligase [Deferribacterales bacterium]
MQVNNLIAGVDVLYANNELLARDVTSISADSKNITKDASKTLFFAYKGASFDSHMLVEKLYKDDLIIGAISERELSVPHILVKDGRRAFAVASANWFNRPDKALKLVAITGTNGKTTTTWLVEAILERAGLKPVRIGTTGVHLDGKSYEIDNTTPSSYDFCRYLAMGVESGAKAAVAELSSHALAQDRLAGLHFDVATFTNLTGDHLDYHKEIESYYRAKKRLFDDAYSRIKVININNDYGKRLYSEVEGVKFSYGMNEGDLYATNYETTLTGINAELSYKDNLYEVHSPLVGEYNLENVLAATASTLVLGIDIKTIVEAISSVGNITGRLERYVGGGVSVFVDYAHTDDALKNVLSALQKLKTGRLIVVFGAGGDRDKTKRPRMGRAVQEYSDLSVVTSDNPRTEEPNSIIEEILAGMRRDSSIHVEVDREKAIKYAIETAKSGDIVVVAGKGHEDYQIIGKTKYHFSDKEVVQRYLCELKNS